MDVRIRHITRYTFDAPPARALQQVRLVPRSCPTQTVKAWSLTLTGGQTQVTWRDHHGNDVSLLSLDAGAHELEIVSEGAVTTMDRAGVLGPIHGPAPLWFYTTPTSLTRPGRRLQALVARLDAPADDALTQLHALAQLIEDTVTYDTGASHSATTAEEALAEGRGVCQDHAHIFIAAARRLGYAARYVSGYMVMDGQIDQEASHAWAEVYLDALGWVGFDVANRISPDERHVRVACGRDYVEAAPVRGLSFGDVTESMEIALQVQQ